MKILHVAPSIGPLRGGPSRAVLDMCRGLAQAGADVTLATTDDNGPGRLGAPPGRALAQDGYRILYFRRTTRAYTSSLGLTAWLARRLHEYDLAHLHAAFTYAPLPAAWLARRRGVPYVVTPHGILGAWGVRARRARAKRLSLALVERPILNRAACVHATSAGEAEGLRALGLRAPVATVHLGVDAPPLEAVARGAPLSPFPPGRVTLLFMGRFHAVKGLDLLLPAFAQALEAAPGIALALAGQGDAAYTAWLKAEVARLGIGAHVTWPGFLDGAAKWRALAAADVALLPSYSESFGVAAVEAMACATPVIVSDQVALSAEVREAGAGVATPCRVQPLRDAIVALATDPAGRQAMGAAGRRLYARRFTVAQAAQAMLRCYERIV